MRSLIRLSLGFLLSCSDGVGELSDVGVGDGEAMDGPNADTGPVVIEYCDGFYYDLDDAGVIVQRDRPCAVGAACSLVSGYGACPPAGASIAVLPGGSLIPGKPTLEMFKAAHQNFPFCSSDSDCGEFGPFCMFEPGCDNPSGICCSFTGVCSVDRIRFDCEIAGCNTYCGCDGVTFNDPPTKPYAHPGACR